MVRGADPTCGWESAEGVDREMILGPAALDLASVRQGQNGFAVERMRMGIRGECDRERILGRAASGPRCGPYAAWPTSYRVDDASPSTGSERQEHPDPL